MTFGIDLIREAAERLRGLVVRTPLLESPQLNEIAGARILVKAESLQLTGSFKLRGALNAALHLPATDRARGLVAYSAGNHGQGVAAAARMLGVPSVVVMPANAPTVKIDNCRWWGAEVVLYDPSSEDREEICRGIVDSRGMALIPPFDDLTVMAGQGTVGLEIAEQAAASGIPIDDVVVAASGGGLAAGVFEAVRSAHPSASLHIAEPAGRDKIARALGQGSSTTVSALLMDALNGPTVGGHPLAALESHVIATHSVTDFQVLTAISSAFRAVRLVVEPGGAAPLAAVLAKPETFAGRTVVIVASGGNVDVDIFARAIRSGVEA